MYECSQWETEREIIVGTMEAYDTRCYLGRVQLVHKLGYETSQRGRLEMTDKVKRWVRIVYTYVQCEYKKSKKSKNLVVIPCICSRFYVFSSIYSKYVFRSTTFTSHVKTMLFSLVPIYNIFCNLCLNPVFSFVLPSSSPLPPTLTPSMRSS